MGASYAHAIGIGGGDSAEKVLKIYGPPKKDKMLENFNPRVMRNIYYDNGLEFLLNSNRVASITVREPFADFVLGLKIGEAIESAIKIHGPFKRVKTSYPDELGHKWDSLPNWFINTTKAGIIVRFTFFDRQIYGDWSLQL